MSCTAAVLLVPLAAMVDFIRASSTHPSLLPAQWTLLAVTFYIAVSLVRRWSRTQSLAPGPRRYPVIGNALQVPSKFLFLRITEWAEQYGQ